MIIFRIVVVAAIVCFASPSYASGFECPDVIENSGKDTAVHYKIQKFNWLKLKCEEHGGVRKHELPLYSAKTCAESRIDGCSLHEAHILFTERDKKLMTPSCNVHDMCYSTFHDGDETIAKIKCDHEFGKNLTKVEGEFDGTYSVVAVVSAVLVAGDISGGQKWAKDHHCGTD